MCCKNRPWPGILRRIPCLLGTYGKKTFPNIRCSPSCQQVNRKVQWGDTQGVEDVASCTPGDESPGGLAGSASRDTDAAYLGGLQSMHAALQAAPTLAAG